MTSPMTAPVVIRDEADSWRWLANEARALIEKAKAADINVSNVAFQEWLGYLDDAVSDADFEANEAIEREREDAARHNSETAADLRRMFPQE